jgi:hypothetical protein
MIRYFLVSLVRLVILNSCSSKGLEIYYTRDFKLYTILLDDFLAKGLRNSLKELKRLGIAF